MNLDHLQIVLCLFTSDNNQVLKISETQVILPSTTNTPIYSYDHVLDFNQLSDYFEKIPHHLLKGKDANIVIFDPSLNRNSLLDTRLVLSLAPLFSCTDNQIYIKFTESLRDDTPFNLLPHEKDTIQITSINDMLRYYKLGLSHHDPSTTSSFTIFIHQETHSSQFIITDISGQDPEHISSLLNINTNVTLLTTISQADDLDLVRRALDITSSFYQKRDGAPSSESEAYLRQTILKMSSELTSLRSYNRGSLQSVSSDQDHKARSTFSSISNFTHLTVPETDEDKVLLSDLNRQIEELQNQVTVTRDRNMHVEHELQHMVSTRQQYVDLADHLLTIQAKQDQLIDFLETKLQETETLYENTYCANQRLEDGLKNIIRDLDHLSLDRHQLGQMFSVVENLIFKQDQDSARALQALGYFRSEFERQEKELSQKNSEIERLMYDKDDPLDQQRTTALENRIKELEEQVEHVRSQRDRFYSQLQEHLQESEKTHHTLALQTARSNSLEKRVAELQADLDSCRKMIKQHDASGLIHKLELELSTLKHQKQIDEKDFEISYENALNESKSMKQVVEQQAKTIECLKTSIQSLHCQLNTNKSVPDRPLSEPVLIDRPIRVRRNSDSSSIISAYGHYNHFETQEECMRWIQENIDDADKEEVMKRLLLENSNLKSTLAGFESQMTSQRDDFTEQIRALESDIVKLTLVKKQLERDLHRVSQGSHGSMESRASHKVQSISSTSSHKSRMRDSDTPKQPRQSNTVIPPPPSEPPSEPIPPLPQENDSDAPAKKQTFVRDDSLHHLELKVHQQQQEIEALVEQQVSSKQKLKDMQHELEMEKKLKQKAERAHEILEKRMQDLMNKKNKFLCF
ncbi:hypothetical protein RMCBS344292_18915 [Rhizopus microsporus]|nr:hypothetical protein RMCBS344292_18915 [Rhizopus microsporus]